MPHISIKAEEVFNIFGFSITNSLLSSFVVLILFVILAFYYDRQKKLPVEERSAFYFSIQTLNNGLYNFFVTVVGEKIDIFFPLLLSFFLYIIVHNWFGLLPGVGSILVEMVEYVVEHGRVYRHVSHVPLLRGNTADLNTTLALGLLSVASSQYFGIKLLGFKGYVHKFFNMANPISFFTGLLEVISEFSKIISFSFRLFGNIFAGEVLLTIIAFLIPVFAPFPFLLLEIFVGFIQALVFATLTAVFISTATSHH